MAYNNYNYPPYQPTFQPYQQPLYQQQAQPVQPLTQPVQQIQSGGFVSVRSEEEARNYPVAPGNSVTFKDESGPYVYTKTMGFSQLDRPQFEKFRLVREEVVQAQNAPVAAPAIPEAETPAYAKSDDLEAVRAELEAVKAQLVELTAKKTAKQKKEDAAE